MAEAPIEQKRPAPGVEQALLSGGRLLMHRAAQYGLAFLAGIIITRALGPAGRAGYSLPLALTGSVWGATPPSIQAASQRPPGPRQATLHQVGGVLAAAPIGISSA